MDEGFRVLAPKGEMIIAGSQRHCTQTEEHVESLGMDIFKYKNDPCERFFYIHARKKERVPSPSSVVANEDFEDELWEMDLD